MKKAGEKVKAESLFGIRHSLRLFLEPNDCRAEAEEYGRHQELSDHNIQEVSLIMSQRKVVAQPVPDVSEGFAVRPVGHLQDVGTTQPKLCRNAQ